LILLGFQAVSAFLSHAAFCTATAFGILDAPHARVSHTKRKSPESNPDYVSSKPAPAFVCVFFDTSVPGSISGFLQSSHPARKIARTRRSSFLETIQVES
jgi:hypothetical protein